MESELSAPSINIYIIFFKNYIFTSGPVKRVAVMEFYDFEKHFPIQ
jgi:hypothetical protein